MPKKTIIITGQMRLPLDPIEHDGQQLDARELAEAARQFLRDELGLSRVHLQAPRAGRGEERGGQVVTPHFIYGTFDFPFEPPTRPRRVELPPSLCRQQHAYPSQRRHRPMEGRPAVAAHAQRPAPQRD